jgi:hypothetical protein
MRRTLESLQDELVKSFEILDFKSGECFYFIKVKAVLKDDSQLHIKEYNSFDSYLYSYHWQDVNGSLRIRWDNSPHHSYLGTFPDPSILLNWKSQKEMSLEEVLKEIKENLKKLSRS